MINGKLFSKFQKLLPKMNKALKAKNCTPNALFMADSEGCMAMEGYSLLYAPVEDACEQPVALTELPKAKFGDAVFIETGKVDATIKDGGTYVAVPKDEKGNGTLLGNMRKFEKGNETLLGKMRKFYVRDMPAYEAPAVITVNATLLKNLLDSFAGDVRIEITHPEGKYYERQIYLHDVSSNDNLQAMLLPVKPVEARGK